MDCKNCKKLKIKWSDCLGKEWYQPAEIDANYCYYQMFFLIWHWDELAEDKWPQAPENTDIEYSPRMIKHHAYYEIPALFRAELEVRLKETKTDGKLLVQSIWRLRRDDEFQEGDPFPQYPFEELDYEARTALFFISGGRKKLKYADWKKQRKYRGS